ncbi:STE3-domain-containing protein [Cucurbitaria berberidis CBS 394.84]|uniref:STE3-domain-containing protein n=1 Tax=Cucurbitaria berberidis CBS 394.84 TaxID=1168544 RepID=A0A9P4LE86_9PLEO|nr:STE3-domain-containing protein [Cucurbitaria berberidis CBS 394.84]KAF1850864.1 STE3-domain-containing protein [Cucurbitaria berberidis CBS 394.84]
MGSKFEVTSPQGASVAPLYPQAVLLPVLGFPAWLLCVLPMIWHFSQRNIAAGSLILWIVMNNFFNSINPLIWPRDNLIDWWDGNVWCDINVRIQIGGIVGLAASTAMIVRKLAKVMDTRNMTVSSSRNSKIKEWVLDVLWCWVYPMVLIMVYYVVQPVRYLLYGIVGCISAFHTSWPSMVLGFMWGPITMLVAAYYAVLLIYRLYRYRREFHRLIAARNTTRSRFIRLFIICMFVILVYLPYTFWVLGNLFGAIQDPYDWNHVHGPQFNTVMKVPVFGQVSIEKWVQVATGYVIFFVFGTGTDSHNLYKKMLLRLGCGRIFTSLHVMRESGNSTPSGFITARTWGSNLSSRAKGMFWSNSGTKIVSATDTLDDSTCSNSVMLNSISHLHNITTEDTLLKQKQEGTQHGSSLLEPSFLKRVFRCQGHRHPVLPLFSRRSITELTETDKSATGSVSPGVHAFAWASEAPVSNQVRDQDVVHVVREIHQDRRERHEVENERKSTDAWA